MRVVLVELSLESPTLVSARAGKYGFSAVPWWIPGSTLRGALLSGAVEFGYLGREDAAREASEPTCVVHPAYPVADGKTSRPATPFVYRCKAEGRLVDILGRDGVKNLTQARSVGEMLQPVIEQRPESLCSIMRDIPGSAKLAAGTPVLPNPDGSVRPVDVRRDILTSVGVSKRRRSAEKGMLYSYEVLLPGQAFRFLATCRDEVVDYLKGERLLYVGRGVSRGFGRCAAVVLREMDMEVAKSKLAAEVAEWVAYSGGVSRLAAYARSPAARWEVWSLSSPVPGRMDTQRLGLDGVSVRVARGEDGRPLVVGGRGTFRSFSLLTGMPRPELACCRVGSVMVLETDADGDTLARAMAVASILGWDSLAHVGLNVIHPLGWWYDDPLYG